MVQTKFKTSATRATKPYELIHSDICGLLPLSFEEGYQYFIIFINDYSRHAWVYFLKRKSDAYDCYKMFLKDTGTPNIKTFRTDNGGEFEKQAWEQYLINAET